MPLLSVWLIEQPNFPTFYLVTTSIFSTTINSSMPHLALLHCFSVLELNMAHMEKDVEMLSLEQDPAVAIMHSQQLLTSVVVCTIWACQWSVDGRGCHGWGLYPFLLNYSFQLTDFWTWDVTAFSCTHWSTHKVLMERVSIQWSHR